MQSSGYSDEYVQGAKLNFSWLSLAVTFLLKFHPI